MAFPKADLTGNVYGLWTVVKFAGRRNRKALWLCRCECGSEKTQFGDNLTKGQTKSCGCNKGAMIASQKIKYENKYSHSIIEYRIWCAIKTRCYNKNNPAYRLYGAVGVTMNEEWKSSFLAFLRDMGHCPGPEYSIDRYPDNRGNYEPGNCRWATPIEQSQNRRNNRKLTFAGETRTVSEWSILLGIPWQNIHSRLSKGWSDERTLTTPIKHNK